jgi:hypothetical protein
LLNDPGAARLFGHITLKDAPPVVRDDEEAVENAEDERWHGEEVHRGDGFAMIAQKRRPSFCWLGIPRSLSHPAQHSSLRNIEAEHLQFSVDAWRAPGWVFGDHSEDEVAQFLADASSSSAVAMAREPRPIQLEPCPMPANDGLRLNKDQCPLPSRPKPLQDHPKDFVRCGESRLRMPLFQNGKLLAKSQIFQEQVAARTDRSIEQDEQELQRTEHELVVAESAVCEALQR